MTFPTFRRKLIAPPTGRSERKDAKLAMAVGRSKHYRMSEIKIRHWQETAEDADLSEKAFQEILNAIIDKTKTIEDSFKKHPSKISDDLIEIIVGGIRTNLKGLV